MTEEQVNKVFKKALAKAVKVRNEANAAADRAYEEDKAKAWIVRIKAVAADRACKEIVDAAAKDYEEEIAAAEKVRDEQLANLNEEERNAKTQG